MTISFSIEWLIGLCTFALIAFLYLLYQLIEVLREYISILKDIFKDDE